MLYFASRYFRDTEVWVNSEPYLASSNINDFTSYALEAGFSPQHFPIYSVPGYYALKNGNKRASWLTFCGQKS